MYQNIIYSSFAGNIFAMMYLIFFLPGMHFNGVMFGSFSAFLYLGVGGVFGFMLQCSLIRLFIIGDEV